MYTTEACKKKKRGISYLKSERYLTNFTSTLYRRLKCIIFCIVFLLCRKGRMLIVKISSTITWPIVECCAILVFVIGCLYGLTPILFTINLKKRKIDCAIDQTTIKVNPLQNFQSIYWTKRNESQYEHSFCSCTCTN